MLEERGADLEVEGGESGVERAEVGLEVGGCNVGRECRAAFYEHVSAVEFDRCMEEEERMAGVYRVR